MFPFLKIKTKISFTNFFVFFFLFQFTNNVPAELQIEKMRIEKSQQTKIIKKKIEIQSFSLASFVYLDSRWIANRSLLLYKLYITPFTFNRNMQIFVLAPLFHPFSIDIACFNTLNKKTKNIIISSIYIYIIEAWRIVFGFYNNSVIWPDVFF